MDVSVSFDVTQPIYHTVAILHSGKSYIVTYSSSVFAFRLESEFEEGLCRRLDDLVAVEVLAAVDASVLVSKDLLDPETEVADYKSFQSAYFSSLLDESLENAYPA